MSFQTKYSAEHLYDPGNEVLTVTGTVVMKVDTRKATRPE